jgi:hypothetical protein
VVAPQSKPDLCKLSVNEFSDRWERDWCAGNVSPNTRDRDAELLRVHVRLTRALTIQNLQPVHLRGPYAALLRDLNLAARTIGHAYRALHRSLGQAKRPSVPSGANRPRGLEFSLAHGAKRNRSILRRCPMRRAVIDKEAF